MTSNQCSVRCVICGSEFTDDEIKDATGCPKCGTKSIPCAIADDVRVNINWHELRILTIWAENWAKQIDTQEEDNPSWEKMLLCVMTIAERIQRQYPDKTPLTLFSEIRQLRKDYNIQTDIDDDQKLGL